jgi:hypothetical protein
LLDQIRQRQGLTEKKPGIFYRRSKSFLHFHEDKEGLFADIAAADGFGRLPVNNHPEWVMFLAALDRALQKN